MKNKDIEIMARTIYGEARGEIAKYGIIPLIAVANVILNRYQKHFAQSIEAVCLAPKQFSCWNRDDANYAEVISVDKTNDVFRKCYAIAENVTSGKYPDITGGCDHYHAHYVKPYWAKNLRPKYVFGSHYFYCLKQQEEKCL